MREHFDGLRSVPNVCAHPLFPTAHGLVVQALFAPGDFPPDLRARLLDGFPAASGSLTALDRNGSIR
jgi:hypothetical protein